MVTSTSTRSHTFYQITLNQFKEQSHLVLLTIFKGCLVPLNHIIGYQYFFVGAVRSGSRTAEVTHHQGTAGGCQDIYAESLDSLREAVGVSISVYYPKSSKYALNVAMQLKHQRFLCAPRPRIQTRGPVALIQLKLGGKLRKQMCGEIKETPRSSAVLTLFPSRRN